MDEFAERRSYAHTVILASLIQYGFDSELKKSAVVAHLRELWHVDEETVASVIRQCYRDLLEEGVHKYSSFWAAFLKFDVIEESARKELFRVYWGIASLGGMSDEERGFLYRVMPVWELAKDAELLDTARAIDLDVLRGLLAAPKRNLASKIRSLVGRLTRWAR